MEGCLICLSIAPFAHSVFHLPIILLFLECLPQAQSGKNFPVETQMAALHRHANEIQK